MIVNYHYICYNIIAYPVPQVGVPVKDEELLQAVNECLAYMWSLADAHGGVAVPSSDIMRRLQYSVSKAQQVSRVLSDFGCRRERFVGHPQRREGFFLMRGYILPEEFRQYRRQQRQGGATPTLGQLVPSDVLLRPTKWTFRSGGLIVLVLLRPRGVDASVDPYQVVFEVEVLSKGGVPFWFPELLNQHGLITGSRLVELITIQTAILAEQ